ncbi:diadenylate cyclase CdaA [Chloracidobacterium sp. MS 40/45]|uniref:diadenylate cyclase CdaA n=1 Tax=Chloracidobacterium aggregatum TaxID=2851959 RepID=UPI001B8C33BC|nr:diadenylate cyclase CdaA [Chloracidobacterium aggregatum]QUV99028.1 diadenylate cyclase CdaA [Chloracidobacterium sp. MS 40/45]
MPTLMHWLGQSWFVAAVDLLLVFLVVYEALKLLKGTRAAQVAVGIAIVAFLYQASHWLRLPTLEFVIRHSLLYVGFAVVVLFQNEIRLAFANFGKNIRLLSRLGWRTQKLSVVQYEDVLLAVATLAANKTGALIVFERQDNLDEYISRGVRLDAVLGYDLLINIFNPEAPLHDGAVIIRQDRIAAASCFLPLTLNPRLSKDTGTRHRSAIGITEESDAFVIVVSEETGMVSCVEGGNIKRGLEIQAVRELLSKALKATKTQGVTAVRRRRRLAEPSGMDFVTLDTPSETSETPATGTPVVANGRQASRIGERGALNLAAVWQQGRHWSGWLGRKLRTLVVENFTLKLIAAVMTSALWLSATKQDAIPFVLRGVPVNYQGLREDLVIANGHEVQEVTLRVRGPRDVVERLRPESFVITVSLAGKNPGDRVILLREDARIEKPTGVEILEIEPPRLTLNLERQVYRQVDIKPNFRGALPVDREIAEYQVVPATTMLRGPEAQVYALPSVGTETIWLNVHDRSFTERYKVDVKDPRIEIVGAQEVEVKVTIRPIIVRRRLDVVLDTPGTPPTRLEVTVEGPKSVVEKLRGRDFQATVATALVSERPPRRKVVVTPPPDLAEQVQVVSVSPDEVVNRRSEQGSTR